MRFSVPRSGRLPGDYEGVHGASWVRAEAGGLPHPVYVRLGLGDDQRLVATGVLVETEGELTARTMRVPLSRIVTGFAAAASTVRTYKRLRRELHGSSASKAEAAWDPHPGQWLAFEFLALPELERPVRRARLRPGPRGHTADHYREVARVYRRAKLQQPRSFIKAFMREMHTTEKTAHRWINTARERGHIKERPGDGETPRGLDKGGLAPMPIANTKAGGR
jgi:hypothetical protein